MVDPSYTESWVSQPDVCRCCLSTSGTWDVTSSYVTETGENEVYSDMLQECYGITLSYLPVWGPSKMVCELCVRHLRDALNFRKQVLQAEQQFMAYRNTTQRVFKPVVLRVETPKAPTSESSSEEDDDKTIDVLALTDSTERPLVDRIAPKKKEPVKDPKYDSDQDLESDTPISEVSKKNNVTESVAQNAGNSSELDSLASVEIPKKKRRKKRAIRVLDPEERKELAKQNEDLRANITLVLKYTTIMPFRYLNNNTFQCQYCDMPYLHFKDLKNHVKVRHWAITEQQIMRTIKFPRDLVKADVSDISCRLCGSNYSTIEKLLEHLKILHDKSHTLIPGLKHSHGILGYDLSDGIKCYVCRKQFQFIKNLTMHLNEHDADYICHVCGKRYLAEHRLSVHLGRHKTPDLRCKYCGKMCKSVAVKNYHIRKVHTNPATYKCPECPQIFSQYNQRLKHMINKHKFKKPELQCHHCAKHFAHNSALSAHIKFRHFKEENMKYVCEICDKAFCDKWLKDRHLTVHMGNKNYECKFCDKKFAKKFTLQVHEKVHLNQRDFPCTMCDKAFVQKYSLTRHMQASHGKKNQ